jgi:hypothetical protein
MRSACGGGKGNWLKHWLEPENPDILMWFEWVAADAVYVCVEMRRGFGSIVY